MSHQLPASRLRRSRNLRAETACLIVLGVALPSWGQAAEERLKLVDIAAEDQVRNPVVAPGSRAVAAYKQDAQGAWIVAWELPAGRRIFQAGPFAAVGAYDFSADGKTLVAVVEEQDKQRLCKRWLTASGKLAGQAPIAADAFVETDNTLVSGARLLPAPGGKLVVALASSFDDAYEKAWLLDVDSGKRLSKNLIGAKGLRPRGGRFYLTVVDDGRLETKDPATRKTLSKLQLPPIEPGPTLQALAADGSFFALGGDDQFLLWNVAGKKAAKPVRYQSFSPGVVAVAAGGKYLAAQNAGAKIVMINDGKVNVHKQGVPLYVWNTSTGAQVGEFWGDLPGEWLRFSDDGKYLLWNEKRGPQIVVVSSLGR